MSRLSFKLSTLFINVGVLCITLAGCLLIFEAVLRTGLIPNPQYDRMKLGRKPAVGDAKARVLILGDSFVRPEGKLSRSLLKALSKHGVESFNAAISGNGPYQYFVEFQSVGRAFNPDLVLLSYYVGNDLTNVQYSYIKNDRGAWSRLKNSLRTTVRRFYLYHLINHFRAAWHLRRTMAMPETTLTEPGSAGARPTVLNPFLARGGQERPNYLLDNLLVETDQNREAWSIITRLLKELKTTANSSGSQLAIVIFPSTLQVNDSHMAMYAGLGYNSDPRILDSRKPQDLLLRLCKEMAVECLDLLPHFHKASSAGQELYKLNDDHLNDDGDRLASRLVAEFVLRQLALR